jgi:hypothetical protein
MLFTASGSIPKHQYVYVDGQFVGMEGRVSAVWFGLHAHPGRAWGCTVMLHSGAVYRNLPPNAIAFCEDAPEWTIKQAQLWDCYGSQFSVLVYDFLDSLDAVARINGEDVLCEYLFTAVPVGDAYTSEPSQDKEFMFLQTRDGRLTIQPTNRVLFVDSSFTDKDPVWPSLPLTTQTYSSEAI